MRKLQDCPRFDTCSAALCPLDPEWKIRRYARDESVCFYLNEVVKPDRDLRFEGRNDRDILDASKRSLPEILEAFPAMCKPIERAQRSGSSVQRGVFTKLTPISSATWSPLLRQKSRRSTAQSNKIGFTHPQSCGAVQPSRARRATS